jgi:hypothetical protein
VSAYRHTGYVAPESAPAKEPRKPGPGEEVLRGMFSNGSCPFAAVLIATLWGLGELCNYGLVTGSPRCVLASAIGCCLLTVGAFSYSMRRWS